MNRLLFLDGATGTHLMSAGLRAGESPEKWLLSDPQHAEVLIALQKQYIEAGSDVIYTPTFGANRAVLGRHGLSENVGQINRSLAALSHEAKKRAGKNVLIAGDMSPSGLFLRPVGETEQAEMEDIFAEQAKALDPFVDLFVVETQLSLAEARAAVLGIRRVSEKKIFVTVTVDRAGKTMTGNTLPCCLLSLAALGVSGFGVNCSLGPDALGELFSQMAKFRPEGLKLICKPNAGVPTENGFSMTPETFAASLVSLCAQGADIVGGCCGTSPAFIRAAKETLPPDLPERNGVDVSHYACDERAVYSLCEYTLTAQRLIADADLEDALFDLPPMTVARIFIENEAQLENITEILPVLDLPVMLGSEDPALLEAALRIYPGKALIEPDCACPPWYRPAVKE